MPRNADVGTLCINCKEKIYDQNAEQDFESQLRWNDDKEYTYSFVE